MIGRTIDLQKWRELAHDTGYQPAKMAKRRGLSLRHAQRLMQKKTGKTPGTWLFELRQLRAFSLLSQGRTPKETAHELGYKQLSHFCRDFKKYYGVTPGAMFHNVE